MNDELLPFMTPTPPFVVLATASGEYWAQMFLKYTPITGGREWVNHTWFIAFERSGTAQEGDYRLGNLEAPSTLSK